MKLRESYAVVTVAACVVVSGCDDATHMSSSMVPTIVPGERVVVDYTAYALGNPKRFDVLAFESPVFTNTTWLMRVIGLPGETIFFTNGNFTVDRLPVILPGHVTNVTYVALGQFGVTSPFTVPHDSYFVLGDNSANANDSRFWGVVPRSNIVGKVRDK